MHNLSKKDNNYIHVLVHAHTLCFSLPSLYYSLSVITFSMLKSGGSLVSMSLASSSITCCGDLPAPPVVLGNVNNMLSNN